MKLEDQVCSLDLAKRLKELGVKQESAFYWCNWNENGVDAWEMNEYCLFSPEKIEAVKSYAYYPEPWKVLATFTVAELGNILPAHTEFPVRYKDGSWWCVFQPGCGSACPGHTKEADARAKMLIHLIETGVVTL